MNERSDTTNYAREVYAACATVGFDGPGVARLKALLDRDVTEDAAHLFEIAWQVQRDAVEWANRPSWPERDASDRGPPDRGPKP